MPHNALDYTKCAVIVRGKSEVVEVIDDEMSILWQRDGEGLIQSPQEISWIKGEKRKIFGKAKFHDGAVILSKF